MISLNKYIKQVSSSSMKMKLNREEKKKLLELDKEYGELVLMYRNDFNTKDISKYLNKDIVFPYDNKTDISKYIEIKVVYNSDNTPKNISLFYNNSEIDCNNGKL